MDDADIAARKAALRAEALAARDALPPTVAIENAVALAGHAEALGEVGGLTVSAYWPIRSEIDPRPLLFALHARGARMALPAVTEGSLVFRLLTRDTTLEPAGFGTHAPGPDAPPLDPDLILLPLAAFDRRGNRLGYGKGYYDRAISALREKGRALRLVGLAHAMQERDDVPRGSRDAPLDAVLCERGLRASSAA